jgi:hypothetical protein
MSAKKKTLTILIPVLVLGLLGGGGYFAYLKLKEQTDLNSEGLAQAGDVLVGSSHNKPDNDLTDEQMAPTISSDLKPSKRVVRSLQKENVKLSIEIIDLKESIESLNRDIAVLEEYKMSNERFAPLRIKDEMVEIERQVKAFLLESEDAGRFGTLQIEIMAAASALEYKEYINRNRLMVTKVQRQKVSVEYLPGYAFCVGDGIELAANNAEELNLIATKFRGTITLPLPTQLSKDLDSVIVPCQNSLRAQLDKNLIDQGE